MLPRLVSLSLIISFFLYIYRLNNTMTFFFSFLSTCTVLPVCKKHCRKWSFFFYYSLMAISSSSTFYTLIYKLCNFAFLFFLIRKFACPSHFYSRNRYGNQALSRLFLLPFPLKLPSTSVCLRQPTGSYTLFFFFLAPYRRIIPAK